MNRLLCSVVFGSALTTACFSAHGQVTLLTELKHFSINDLPAYRDGTTVEQESSYDRTGGNNDGFSGTYSFVRRNPDSSLILLDIDGPGEINRFATPTPTKDTLDFYIDRMDKPTLSIAYPDLFSGKVYPFVAPLSGSGAGGYYTYFPILFQRHCRIVSRGHHEQFHQIQYRLFPAGSRVYPFSPRLTAEEKTALHGIGADWALSPMVRLQKLPARRVHVSVTLPRGGQTTVLDLEHGGRLQGIDLAFKPAIPGAAGNIAFRLYWDDDQRPAVDCPVADFFGFAYGRPSMQGILIGSDSGRCYSLLPMPFDHRAKLELVDLRKSDTAALASLTVDITCYVSDEPRNPRTEGRFYTQRAHDTTKDGKPWQLARISGKGHYVGSVLLGMGMKPGLPLFWEGDDSTVADDRMTIHGTGTEDYFNGGWYDLKGRWDSARSFPLSGCLEYSRLRGRTGGYRFYLNDKLSFSRDFLETIEHGGVGNHVPGIYTSVGYYYSDRVQSGLRIRER